MTYEQMLHHHGDGERRCPVCKDPLPAHDTWPGHRFQYCGQAECAAKVNHYRFIPGNSYRCEGPNCQNFVPEGFYDLRAGYYTCCGECWIRRRTKGNRLLTCGCGCNRQFLGRAERKPIDGKYFLSPRHYGDYQHKQYVIEMAGPYADLFNEYLEGFAEGHYSEVQTARRSLGPWFRFLQEEGITSLQQVTPKTVTKYIAWAHKSGRAHLHRVISYVSTFFMWAIVEGHYKGGNPVVSLIHRMRVPKSMPRPLEDDELEFTWKLLKERGNSRLRLAAAIAEEAGLRIGEICRIRLSDIDTKRRRLFVRLPNKGKEERWAFFSDKTLKYYKEWMKERDPNCGHDSLLHNMRGNPCLVAQLGQEFRRTLCKEIGGKKLHETGFDNWLTHRFRHTMATHLANGGADATVVMASGGWKTFEAMGRYTRVNPDVARRGYDEAMKRSREKKATRQRKPINLDELRDHFKKTA